MSSAVVSTSAALGRPFVFDADSPTHGEATALAFPMRKDFPGEKSATARREQVQSAIQNQKIPPASIALASQLEIRPAPDMTPSGILSLDVLTGGLPRGCLTEVCGPASSGRTTVLLATLAAATRRGEYCALIDASDSLDPNSLAASGVNLDRLLWVRCNDDTPQKNSRNRRNIENPGNKNLQEQESGCPISRALFSRERGASSGRHFHKENSHIAEHRLEQVLRATDLLLESGGFGLIVLDLAEIPPQSARRIPLTTWFRFRRAVEHKSTVLLTIEQQPIAGSCSSLLLRLKTSGSQLSVLGSQRAALRIDEHQQKSSHTELMTGLEISVELVRSRMDRKPSRSIAFTAKSAWAG